MRNNDPLASLNMAPSAAQLEYRNSAPDRVNNFLLSATPFLKTAAKGIGDSFTDSFVGDSYSDDVRPTISGYESESVSSPFLSNILNPSGSSGSSNSYGSSRRTGTTAKPITYSEWTPAAQHFGMDQVTAYSEHMANTAHQREVADLRAAGLNPVLGLGSGASGVAGSVASSVGSGYSGSSSAKKDNGKLIDAIGATTAVIATLVTKNPTTGGMIGSAVKALGKAFSD